MARAMGDPGRPVQLAVREALYLNPGYCPFFFRFPFHDVFLTRTLWGVPVKHWCCAGTALARAWLRYSGKCADVSDGGQGGMPPDKRV